jgi:hypothetical protein
MLCQRVEGRCRSYWSRAGLALAGIRKETFHGINHGIVVLNISAAIQYHAMCVEPFMVLVIAHVPRRIGQL